MPNNIINIQLYGYDAETGEYSKKLAPYTKVENVRGLLDNHGTIKVNLLPTAARTGQALAGMLPNSTYTLTELYTTLMARINATPTGDETPDELMGTSPISKYFVATTTVTIYPEVGSNHFIIFTDEDSTPPKGEQNPELYYVTLEPNDQLVYVRSVYFENETKHYWGIINNTYRDATIETKGIVKLTDDTNLGINIRNVAVTPHYVKSIANDLTSSITAVSNNLIAHTLDTYDPGQDVFNSGTPKFVSQITRTSAGHLKSVIFSQRDIIDYSGLKLVTNKANELGIGGRIIAVEE